MAVFFYLYTGFIMAKMGRPEKNINAEEFEKLCSLQCSKLEICYFFDISDKTLDKWCKKIYNMTFSEVFKQKRTDGKIALRRNLFKMSQTNASVSIFLAKNWLGMSDKQEISHKDETDKPIEINIIPAKK